MSRPSFSLPCVTIFLFGVSMTLLATPPFKEISLAELRDKIQGGWAGQMIGVSYGAPTEFRYLEKIIPEKELPEWAPDKVRNALDQDDLYVDMTFAKVLDDKGINATTEDFGAMFKNAKYRLWHANLAARRALKRGVSAELSGTPKYNIHANDIDFQIEADFIGLMAPGLPQSANEIAERAGKVMNYGDGIYGGMFVGCMYSAAFFENDPRRVVEAGLACIPAKSPYGLLIKDVLDWSKQSNDWIAVWNRVEQKWNRREPCPEGAGAPFNIDAKLNGGYIAIGLLYGKGEIGETIRISTRCGQDSDCNPASAAGIVGVMTGYNKISDHWKGGIPKLADEKFNYTDYSFRTIVDSNVKRAVALVEKTGGRVQGEKLMVKTQAPKARTLPLWDDYGSPVERITTEDPRWAFKGEWNETKSTRPMRNKTGRIANKKGAEASIDFDGTGAVIVGSYLPTGGKAAIYLDGKLDRTVDVFPDEDSPKGGESVWHAFGLRNGKHSLKLVVLGEPYPGSKGADIEIQNLVVFR
jgi:hypothetical protein